MSNRKCKLCSELGKGHDYYVSKTREDQIKVFVCDRCLKRIIERKEQLSERAKRAWETRKAK
jgi:ribosome-binding protein aMBF1 (putative translation factor)